MGLFAEYFPEILVPLYLWQIICGQDAKSQCRNAPPFLIIATVRSGSMMQDCIARLCSSNLLYAADESGEHNVTLLNWIS